MEVHACYLWSTIEEDTAEEESPGDKESSGTDVAETEPSDLALEEATRAL
jgi:hypothetical protein